MKEKKYIERAFCENALAFCSSTDNRAADKEIRERLVKKQVQIKTMNQQVTDERERGERVRERER